MSRSNSRPSNRSASPRDLGASTALAARPVSTPTMPQRTGANAGAPAPASSRQAVTLPISHEQIAAAAYELWKKRGGSAEQNWLEAEAKLRAQAAITL